MDDQRLIQDWRRGRPEAAQALVQRYYPRMLNLFYRLTGTRETAEELTQELFVRLTRHVASDQQVDDLAAWLYRVGNNLWNDWARRTVIARQKGIAASGGDESLLGVAAPDHVEAIAVRYLEQEAVRAAVLELSPAHREVVVLCYYQGLPYQEIAEITGVPIGTVRSRLHYAVQALRSKLGIATEGGM